MEIRKLITRIPGSLAKLAGRLPWRKEFALAALFIGTPLITGDMEVFVLNLLGLAVAALVLRRVSQARSRAWQTEVRQSTQGNSISTGKTR